MQSIRWGLLSTANINRRLIPAIRASKRGKLVAVASRSQESAEAYAAQWKIPHAFGSYESMLTSGLVDVVYISLPNHLHAEWSIHAMQAGMHVLCEKPLALSLDEVDAMIMTSQKTKRICSEAFMYRHHPQTKTAGELVRSGKLGDICVVRAVFNFSFGNKHDKTGQLNIRLDPEKGGGCLWDVGVYPLSFAQYVMGGPPQWVSASQWIGETGVDEVFTGQMHYPDNGIAQISGAFRSPYYTFAEIFGTEGVLTLNRPFTNMDRNRHLNFYSNNGEHKVIPVPTQDLYLGEVDDMHAAILDGATPYLSLGESRNQVRTILTLYEAARTQSVKHL